MSALAVETLSHGQHNRKSPRHEAALPPPNSPRSPHSPRSARISYSNYDTSMSSEGGMLSPMSLPTSLQMQPQSYPHSDPHNVQQGGRILCAQIATISELTAIKAEYVSWSWWGYEADDTNFRWKGVQGREFGADNAEGCLTPLTKGSISNTVAAKGGFTSPSHCASTVTAAAGARGEQSQQEGNPVNMPLVRPSPEAS